MPSQTAGPRSNFVLGLILCAQRSPDDFPKDDFRRSIPRYSHENFPNILKLCDGLAALGRKHNASAGQVALAWLLAQGPDVIPIPGTTKLKVRPAAVALANAQRTNGRGASQNLRENLHAIKVKLSTEDVEEVRRIADLANATAGDRYPAAMQAMLYVDTPPLVQ